jgi:hypothetical protein
MRWSARLLFSAIVLLLAYVAWPLFALQELAESVEERDPGRLSRLLDYRELKRSLSDQIVQAYLRQNSRERSRTSLLVANLALQVARAAADAVVTDMLTADALIELLKQGRADTFARTGIDSPSSWGLPNFRNARSLLHGAEYYGRNFYVTVPLSAEIKDRYRLRFRLSQWSWRLAGIDLPETQQDHLVRELLKRMGR